MERAKFHSALVTAPLTVATKIPGLPMDRPRSLCGMAPMVVVPILIFLLWTDDDGSF